VPYHRQQKPVSWWKCNEPERPGQWRNPRQKILLRKLFRIAPELGGEVFDPSVIAESGLIGCIGEFGK
jgi:hypothetical protein